MVAKRRTVVKFGLVSRLRVSKVSTVTGIGGSWSRNAELSSCLDSSRLFASQKCQPSQGSGGFVVAKRRTVVTFGLVSGLRVSKVSTVTVIGGVVVARRRTVVTFRLVSGLRVSKVSTVTGIGGVVVTRRRTVVTFRLVSGLRVSKSQQSQGSGGSWSRDAELSSLLALPLEKGEERGERRKER